MSACLAGDCRLSFRSSMMKPMNFSETIFLFFLALIIFGPKKLPEIARQAGKWMAEFRRASNEFKAQIEQEIAHLEVEERKKTILPPSPAQEGTTSRTLNGGPSDLSSSSATPTDGSAVETGSIAAPATSAASEDEPLFATAAAAAAVAPSAEVAEPLPATEAATASPSQEHHA
jgi:sec-independent protein translocase protein TatB